MAGEDFVMSEDNAVQLERKIDEFLVQLRRGVIGSHKIVKKTLNILKEIIESEKWLSSESLLEGLKLYEKKMTGFRPSELFILNTVRRVLFFVREECNDIKINSQISRDRKSDDVRCRLYRSNSDSAGLLKVLGGGKENSSLGKEDKSTLKEAILECINQFEGEIEGSYTCIGDQAKDHIHVNEVVMTYGSSKAVECFLKAASVDRHFELIVVEGSPTNTGHKLIKVLSNCKNIKITLIAEASIFALISRVNKVIIVLANGGLITKSGMHSLSQAAKYHSVPLVVCAGMYKLSPLYYLHDDDMFNEWGLCSEILDLEDGRDLNVSAFNPMWDYIPPELVSLYITNLGCYSPSYIYRLIAEYYHPEDIII